MLTNMLDIVIQEKYREAAEGLDAVSAPIDAPKEPAADATTMTFPPAKGYLSLNCRKCTKLNQFIAPTQSAAQLQAKAAGWKMTPAGPVCKKCPC